MNSWEAKRNKTRSAEQRDIRYAAAPCYRCRAGDVTQPCTPSDSFVLVNLEPFLFKCITLAGSRPYDFTPFFVLRSLHTP